MSIHFIHAEYQFLCKFLTHLFNCAFVGFVVGARAAGILPTFQTGWFMLIQSTICEENGSTFFTFPLHLLVLTFNVILQIFLVNLRCTASLLGTCMSLLLWDLSWFIVYIFKKKLLNKVFYFLLQILMFW